MADFMADLNGIYGNKQVANQNINIQQKGDNTKLDMTSFIQLMITQLTNQGIDESVDTSDMLNQMIQMQMVETMANLTDASVMSYAASLVGKEVTVGKFDSEGKLQEIVGTVTGTGTLNGRRKSPVKRRNRMRPKNPVKRRSRMRPKSPVRRRSRTRPRNPAGRRIRSTTERTAHPMTRGRDMR